MTTFTIKYSAEEVSAMFPGMAEEDKGATLEIVISYRTDIDGRWEAVTSEKATMTFPSGEVEDYTYEIDKHFREEMGTSFSRMAAEHAAS